MKRVLALGFFVLSGCVPDVYLIDRQTVLENEASGGWPELDSRFKKDVASSGPLPLEKTRDSVERRQIFTMTHSDKEGVPAEPPVLKGQEPSKAPAVPKAKAKETPKF